MGQPLDTPPKDTAEEMVNLHPLQIEDLPHHGPATNIDTVLNLHSATHNEGPEDMLEPQQTHEAINIWNTTKQLGATGGDEQHIIIEKLKKMEKRDKEEAERLGDTSRCP